jgi:hypothetical protein
MTNNAPEDMEDDSLNAYGYAAYFVKCIGLAMRNKVQLYVK